MTTRPRTPRAPKPPPGVREFVIGLDPGSTAPRHVLLPGLAHPDPIIAARPFRGGGVERSTVIVESQWVNRDVSRQSLMTLSFYCGLHCGSYLDGGAEVWVIPVRVWRCAVLPSVPSAGTLNKIVCQNLLRSRTPALVLSDGPDAVDAYWIGVAGRELLTTRTPAELKVLKLRKLDWTKRR